MKILLMVVIFAGFWAFALLYVVAGPTSGSITEIFNISNGEAPAQDCGESHDDGSGSMYLPAKTSNGLLPASDFEANFDAECDHEPDEANSTLIGRISRLGLGSQQ